MSVDTPFDVAVLAGGRSTRMGRDKALVTLEGETLLARQVALARVLRPERIWISGRGQAEADGLGASGLPDEAPGQGPLGGVATVLGATRAPHVLVFAVDMPALTADFLRRCLLERRSDGVGVAPRLRGRWEPAAAVYPRDLAGAARTALAQGRRSLQEFIEAALAARRLVAVEVGADDERVFTNWNTPADLPSR